MIARTLLSLILTFCSLSCASRAGRRQAVSPAAVPIIMSRQVRNAVDAGEGDLAARALRRKLAAEPHNREVRLRLAAHYAALGHGELATEHYRLAAERFPDDAEVHVLLARTLRGLRMSGEAAVCLEGFIERNPQAPADVFSWAGILRDESGDLPSGEQAHRRALALAPGTASMHNNLGYNLLLQGRAEQAAAEFRRALALEPRSVLARNNLGIALAADPREAVLHWQSVSDPATAHSNLAAIMIEKGQYEEARKELSIALGYRRDHPAALGNLRLLSELDGRPAAVPLQEHQSFWAKFAAVMRKALWEPVPESPERIDQAALR